MPTLVIDASDGGRAVLDAVLTAPTLVISGSEDVPEIIALADQIAEGIADSRRARIGGAGHLPALEKPGEFNAQVERFLSKIGPGQ